MEIAVYRKTALSLTDISDYVISLSGLDFRQNWDFRKTVMKLSIEIPKSQSITTDDEIWIKFDGDFKMMFYVEKITIDYENLTKTIEAPELIYKLKDYFIGDIKQSDWSSWITPTIMEYQDDNPSNPVYWKKQYISVLFLFMVMVHKADVGYISSFSAGGGTTSYFDRVINSGGTVRDIEISRLGIYLRQLSLIGKDKSDENYKGSTLLQVFLQLIQMINLSWDYYVDTSNNVCVKIYSLGSPLAIADDDQYDFSKQDKKEYEAFKGSETYFSDKNDYYGTTTPTTETTDEVLYPSITADRLKSSKSYQMLKHLVLYEIDSASHQMEPFDNTFPGAKSDLQQWIEQLWALNSAFDYVENITTKWQYDIDILKNRINIKDHTSEVAYYG